MAKTAVWQIGQLAGLMEQGAITRDDLSELLKKGYKIIFPPIIEEFLVAARKEISRIKHPYNRALVLAQLVRTDHNPKEEERLLFFSACRATGWGFNTGDDIHKIIAEEYARKGELGEADRTIEHIRELSTRIETELIIAGISDDPARLEAVRQRIERNRNKFGNSGYFNVILSRLAKVEIKFGNLPRIDKILGEMSGDFGPYWQTIVLIELAKASGEISFFERAEKKIATIDNPLSVGGLCCKLILAYNELKMTDPVRRVAERITEDEWTAPAWSLVAGLTGNPADFEKARLACQKSPQPDGHLGMLAVAYAKNMDVAQARAVAGQIRDPYYYALSLIEMVQTLKEVIES